MAKRRMRVLRRKQGGHLRRVRLVLLARCVLAAFGRRGSRALTDRAGARSQSQPYCCELSGLSARWSDEVDDPVCELVGAVRLDGRDERGASGRTS